MKPRQIFLLAILLFALGDILGILSIGSIFVSSYRVVLYTSIVILLCIGFFQKKAWIVLIFLSVFLWWYTLGSSVEKKHSDAYKNLQVITGNFTEKITIRGKITKELYRKDRSRTFLMKIDNFDNFAKNNNSGSIEAKTHEKYGETSIFLEIPSNLTLREWDRVEVTGKIRSNLSFPLKWFSRYAFFQGGYGYLFAPSFQREDRVGWWFFDRVIGYWQVLFQDGFPREVAGTLLGMTLGSFELLPSELKASFVASGISHILVVSGSNIALLIVFLTFFLKYFHIHKTIRIGFISFCIIFYVLLVGLEISVIRAAIMGIIGYIAVEWGERISSRATLGLAFLVAIIVEPLGPLYDAGFALSFAATLGIILFQKNITLWLQKYNTPTLISSSLAITLWASIGSLPILLYHFWVIPAWSIVTNVLITGFLGWILFSGIIYAWLSLVSSSLSYLFGFLVYLPTHIVIRISRVFDGGYIITVPPDIALILCIFLLGVLSFFFVSEG